jgi:hypothetical protein
MMFLHAYRSLHQAANPSTGRLLLLFWVSTSYFIPISWMQTHLLLCYVFFLAKQLTHICTVAFEFLESIAYAGIALNLVVYLGTVLHGTTASNAATVDTWNGTTFLTPVLGAFLADTYWGKYKTVGISIIFYLTVSTRILDFACSCILIC